MGKVGLFLGVLGVLGGGGVKLGFCWGSVVELEFWGRRGNKVGLGKDIFLAEEGCIVVKLNV